MAEVLDSLLGRHIAAFQRLPSPEVAGRTDLYQFDDPTYFGFYLFYDFSSENSPLLNVNGKNSAFKYLKSIGKVTEANLLYRFVTTLRAIQDYYFYMYQTVKGLDKIQQWKNGNNFRAKDVELEIECLESLDLKMHYMKMCYENSTYDWNWMKVLIPDNLRKFSMTVSIFELRNFMSRDDANTTNQKRHKGDLGAAFKSPPSGNQQVQLDLLKPFRGKNPKSTSSDPTRDSDGFIKYNYAALFAAHIPTMVYVLDWCEFDFSESMTKSSEISNKSAETPVDFKFKIKVNLIYSILQFPQFGTYIKTKLIGNGGTMLEDNTTTPKNLRNLYVRDTQFSDQTNRSPNAVSNSKSNLAGKSGALGSRVDALKDSAVGQLKKQYNALKEEATSLPNTLVNRALDNLTNRITGLVFGNVYDFRNQGIEATASQALSRITVNGKSFDLGQVFNSPLNKAQDFINDNTTNAAIFKKIFNEGGPNNNLGSAFGGPAGSAPSSNAALGSVENGKRDLGQVSSLTVAGNQPDSAQPGKTISVGDTVVTSQTRNISNSQLNSNLTTPGIEPSNSTLGDNLFGQAIQPSKTLDTVFVNPPSTSVNNLPDLKLTAPDISLSNDEGSAFTNQLSTNPSTLPDLNLIGKDISLTKDEGSVFTNQLSSNADTLPDLKLTGQDISLTKDEGFAFTNDTTPISKSLDDLKLTSSSSNAQDLGTALGQPDVKNPVIFTDLKLVNSNPNSVDSLGSAFSQPSNSNSTSDLGIAFTNESESLSASLTNLNLVNADSKSIQSLGEVSMKPDIKESLSDSSIFTGEPRKIESSTLGTSTIGEITNSTNVTSLGDSFTNNTIKNEVKGLNDLNLVSGKKEDLPISQAFTNTNSNSTVANLGNQNFEARNLSGAGLNDNIFKLPQTLPNNISLGNLYSPEDFIKKLPPIPSELVPERQQPNFNNETNGPN